MPAPAKIIVFDSGLGGLTVLREIVAVRPDADIVYVADDAFFPYGSHSEAAIVGRVVPLIGELIAAHKPDIVVIACNTASTLVMPHLRAAYGVPFVGTVPAVKPACAASKTKQVSVLGTSGTIKRDYTHALIRDFAQSCTVTLVGAANLAALAEAALGGAAVDDDAILAEIAPCFVPSVAGDDRRTDAVVLACTHYPLLLDRLEALAPWPVTWIDPAPAIARRVANLLAAPDGADAGAAAMMFTSGRRHPGDALLRPFFGGRIPA